MKYLLLFFSLFFTTNLFANDPPSQESILKLAGKFHQTRVINGLMDGNIKILSRSFPNYPMDKLKKKKEEISVKRLVELYQKAFTQEEVDTLNTLYENKLLQRLEIEKAGVQIQLLEEIREWKLHIMANY